MKQDSKESDKSFVGFFGELFSEHIKKPLGSFESRGFLMHVREI